MGQAARVLLVLLLAFSLASVLSVPAGTAQPMGQVVIASDLQLLSLGDLSGGGRVTWTLTGEQAKILRQKVLWMFDGGTTVPRGFTFSQQSTGATTTTVGNGRIDPAEAGQFLDYLENQLEGVAQNFAGTDFRYVRITRADRIEPDLPADRSAEGLVDQTANATSNVIIRFIFNANSRGIERVFRQADEAFAHALHGIFSLDADWDISGTVYPFPAINGWRPVQPAANSTMPFATYLWHGRPGARPGVDTGVYAPDASNATWYSTDPTGRTEFPVDLRYATNASLRFNHTGGAAAGDFLVIQASLDGASWTNLLATDDGDGQPPVDGLPIDVIGSSTYDLAAYLGKKVYVRFNFTANGDPTVGGYGYFLRDIRIQADSRYVGQVDFRHTDFVVGMLSFSDFASPSASPQLIRTPVGEIMFYSATFPAGSPPQDTAKYATFGALENPQVLFVLLVVAAWLTGFLRSRIWEAHRMKYPLVMRASAKKERWLDWVSRLVVILLILLYFFPTALGVFVGGLAFWVMSIGSLVGLTAFTQFWYARKARLIPPEPAYEPGEVAASMYAPPAPGPDALSARLICAHCDQDIESPADSYTCACGQAYHRPHAAELGTCPNCGRAMLVKAPPVAKMITVKCPTCEEIDVVEEGMDLAVTKCSNCGVILKDVARGFNYLMIAEEPEVAYSWFNSLVRKGVPGLVMSTTFPEKLKREHGLPDVELYWLSDTNPGPKTLDPKRLDFEIMRALSNFVKNYKGGALVLDGVEYLTVENGFDRVLKFIKKVNDLSSVHDSTMFVPVTPAGLGPEETTLLRKEFDKVEVFGDL